MFIVVILLFWLLLWLLFLIFLILVIIVTILIVLIVVVITITIITYYLLAQAHLPECPTLLTWRGAFHQFLLQEKFASSKVWLTCGPGMLWWAAPCILVTAELAMVQTFLPQWWSMTCLRPTSHWRLARFFLCWQFSIFCGLFCSETSMLGLFAAPRDSLTQISPSRMAIATPFWQPHNQWRAQLAESSITAHCTEIFLKLMRAGRRRLSGRPLQHFFDDYIYVSFLHQGSFSGPTQTSSRAKLALKNLVFSEEFALIDGFLLKLHWHDRRCIYTASEHTCCKMLHPPQVGVVLKTTSRRTSGQSTTRPVAQPWQQGMPHYPRR